MYRQTLNLLTRSENFAAMVRYVFAEQAVLAKWNTDLTNFHQAIVKLKNEQASSGTWQSVKDRLEKTNLAWSRLIADVKALPEGQYLLLQSDAAQVEKLMFSLAGMTGCNWDQRICLIHWHFDNGTGTSPDQQWANSSVAYV